MGVIATRTGMGTVTMGVGESEKSISARGSDVAAGDAAGASVAAGDVAGSDSSGKKRSRTEHSSASAMAYILSMVGLPWM